MIDDSKYIFRDATMADIDFLSKVIVEAKKGTSNTVGMAKLFDLSLDEFREYVRKMLDEEIEGCDFSVSSFIIAEYEGRPVAAFGGWIEGDNEDEMPSTLLKSNLIGFVIPMANILVAKERGVIVSGLQVEKEKGAYQLEYGYTIPEHRGHHLIGFLIDKHIERALAATTKPSKMQLLVYDNNIPAITAYTKKGFKIAKRLEAANPEVLIFYPHNRELLLEKEL